VIRPLGELLGVGCAGLVELVDAARLVLEAPEPPEHVVAAALDAVEGAPPLVHRSHGLLRGEVLLAVVEVGGRVDYRGGAHNQPTTGIIKS